MNSFGITDRGVVRKNNQDSFIIEKCEKRKCVVAVVCDGMGGAVAGDLASKLASKAFVTSVFETLSAPNMFSGAYEKLLRDSCLNANGVVFEYSRYGKEYDGMGTTLVGGVVTKRKAYIVNVGDSRAYCLGKGGIRQISRDHSYVQELVSSGAITEEEAKNHPKKNIITRALGVERSLLCDYFEVPLKKADAVLLCSDGLTNTVSDEEIYSYYKLKETPQDVCRGLMELALKRGARDNVSIVMIRI